MLKPHEWRVTEPQRKFIRGLMGEVERGMFLFILWETSVDKIPRMTRDQASAVIDKLLWALGKDVD